MLYLAASLLVDAVQDTSICEDDTTVSAGFVGAAGAVLSTTSLTFFHPLGLLKGDRPAQSNVSPWVGGGSPSRSPTAGSIRMSLPADGITPRSLQLILNSTV